jgi:hypothetical protein
MEYWKQKYEIERRLTGEQEKIWKELSRELGLDTYSKGGG